MRMQELKGTNYIYVTTHTTIPKIGATVGEIMPKFMEAIEAGATDYCSAPFEPRQISWLMQSALGRARVAAA